MTIALPCVGFKLKVQRSLIKGVEFAIDDEALCVRTEEPLAGRARLDSARSVWAQNSMSRLYVLLDSDLSRNILNPLPKDTLQSHTCANQQVCVLSHTPKEPTKAKVD